MQVILYIYLSGFSNFELITSSKTQFSRYIRDTDLHSYMVNIFRTKVPPGERICNAVNVSQCCNQDTMFSCSAGSL